MAPTTENAIISKRDSVVWCDLSGEVVLLDISSGVYFGMKDRGARQFPVVGTTVVGDYRANFVQDVSQPGGPGNWQVDRNGQQSTHDITSEFDDLLVSGGN